MDLALGGGLRVIIGDSPVGSTGLAYLVLDAHGSQLVGLVWLLEVVTHLFFLSHFPVVLCVLLLDPFHHGLSQVVVLDDTVDGWVH